MKYPTFGFDIPTSVPGIFAEVLDPRKSWLKQQDKYNQTLTDLGQLFLKNFESYKTEDIVKAGPRV